MREKGYTIGIDAGGTKVAYGLFDAQGELVDRYEHPSDQEADGPAFADRMAWSVQMLLDKHASVRDALEGVGVVMPSYIMFDKGYIFLTSALPKVQDFYMRDYLREKLNVPVLLDNDANAAALAEFRKGAGAGRGLKHMVYFTVSTGIGSGLIINGDVFRGSYGFAGEAGHMLITPDEGIECGCGNQGCFMSYGSGRYVPMHILRKLHEGRESVLSSVDETLLSCRDLLTACRQKDALAMEMLDQMAHYMAVCAYNIYQLLNINFFVFGGGLTAFGDLLFDRVRAQFDRYDHIGLPVEFTTAALKQDFGIIGASELIRTALPS